MIGGVDMTVAWQAAVYQRGPGEAALVEKLAMAERNKYAMAMERGGGADGAGAYARRRRRRGRAGVPNTNLHFTVNICRNLFQLLYHPNEKIVVGSTKCF